MNQTQLKNVAYTVAGVLQVANDSHAIKLLENVLLDAYKAGKQSTTKKA